MIRSTVFLTWRLPSGSELVSAAPLAIEPFLELDLRDPSRRVQVDPFAARAPDATPAAHKRQILKERRFDRQDVKSGHVLGAIDPFEHENLKKGRIVRVRGHGPQLRRKNPIMSNEWSESIASLRFRIRIDCDLPWAPNAVLASGILPPFRRAG